MEATRKVLKVEPGTTQRLDLSFPQDPVEEALQVAFPAGPCLTIWPLKSLLADLVKSTPSDAAASPPELQVNFSGLYLFFFSALVSLSCFRLPTQWLTHWILLPQKTKRAQKGTPPLLRQQCKNVRRSWSSATLRPGSSSRLETSSRPS